MSIDDFQRTPADEEADIQYERGTGEFIRRNFQGSIFYSKDKSGKVKSAIMVLPRNFVNQSDGRRELWLCAHNYKAYLLSKQLRPHAILLNMQTAAAKGRQSRFVIPPAIRKEFNIDGNGVVTITRIKDGVYVLRFSKKQERVDPVFEFEADDPAPREILLPIPKDYCYDPEKDEWFIFGENNEIIVKPDPRIPVPVNAQMFDDGF